LKKTVDTPGFSCSINKEDTLLYLSDFYSMRIYDLSDTLNPVPLGVIETEFYLTTDITISNNYAYLSDYRGIEIVDISNPYKPQVLPSYVNGYDCLNISSRGNLIYFVDESEKFNIIDMSNPFSPVELGACSILCGESELFIYGNYAYISEMSEGFTIVDISDSTNPVMKSNTDLSGWTISSCVQGNYAYITSGSELKILNISDPEDPTYVSTYASSADARYIDVSGDYAYLAVEDSGLIILDIHNPYSPTFVSQINVCKYPKELCVNGNYVFIGDSENGLRMIDVSDVYNPEEVGFYIPKGALYGIHVSEDLMYICDMYYGLYIVESPFYGMDSYKEKIQDANNRDQIDISLNKIIYKMDSNKNSMKIYDLLGDEVFSVENGKKGTNKIETNKFTSGVYFIKMIDGETKITEKFTIIK